MLKRLTLVFVLGSVASALAASPSIAAEASSATDQSSNVLTAEEGKKLYELGVRTGQAQAIVQSAQQDMKPILDKIASPKR